MLLKAPVAELIPGTKVRWKSFEILENGSEIEGPWREGYKETHFEWFDHDINQLQLDPFVYTKTGPNTATVVIQHVGSVATHNITYKNRFEGYTDSTSVSDSGGTYYSRIIFEEIDEFSDDSPLKASKLPVFWITPELFWELTYIDWEWTSFARFEDPQMGRGAYFAFEATESEPAYYDPVYGDHEILESYDLIHVTELVPVGLPSVWMASPDMEVYNTKVSPQTLESEHNLTIAGYYTLKKGRTYWLKLKCSSIILKTVKMVSCSTIG